VLVGVLSVCVGGSRGGVRVGVEGGGVIVIIILNTNLLYSETMGRIPMVEFF